MKSFFICYMTLFALAFSQHGIPVPVNNISNLQGDWYVAYSFNSEPFPDDITCPMYSYSINGNAIHAMFTYYIGGQTEVETDNFEANSAGDIWEFSNDVSDEIWILGYDPVGYSWLLWAQDDNGVLLTRSSNPASSALLTIAFDILGAESYNYNQNFIQPNNTQCNSTSQ